MIDDGRSVPRTFLFTDIEDSTRLWQGAPVAMQAALARHDTIVRGEIEAAGGHVFKAAGDAFYSSFDAPARAVEAALAVRRSLRAEAWPRDAAIRVRMALHHGAAHSRAGDWFGPPLNVAARMLSIARGGQTLFTDTLHALTVGGSFEGARIERHGHFRLKGVDAPVEILELGLAGDPSRAPPMDTDAVYRVYRSADEWVPVREIRHNLPAERDSFVGRGRELAMMAQRLEDGARLVTVLGVGGTGKTRLVRRYARTWLGDWPGGVWFCDLSEAHSLQDIHSAVALAMDVPLGRGDAGEQLGHAIAGRRRCLVVLDNFEQVALHADATVGRWLDRAVQATFVVTSRERLHVAGEDVFVLDPMPLGDEAIELFAVRARAQSPGFAISDANRASVAEVARLVDGLPLAIELAAARVRALSPAGIVERMKDRFRLLAGARGTAARQATLEAAIEWSWELLAPWEQAALAQCSVFEGSFTLEAAEAVLDLSRWPEATPALDAVQSLVDKSLLRTWSASVQERYAFDEPYFGMYLSIQAFADRKLRASGPLATRTSEERHGRYFAGFGAEATLESLYRDGGTRRRRELALERDNVLAACRRAIARGDGATAVPAYRAAWELVERQGPFALGVALGVQVQSLDGIDAAARAIACVIQTTALRRVGRVADAEPLAARALALASEANDRHAEALALVQVGHIHNTHGRFDEAFAAIEAALNIHREKGERRLEAEALGNIANLEVGQGGLKAAEERFEAALAIHRELGNRRAEGGVRGGIAVVLQDQGRMEEARPHYEAALEILREVGDRLAEGIVLGNLGTLENDLGRLDAARATYEAALAIHRDMGDREGECVTLGNLAKLCADSQRAADARLHYDAALAISREMGNRRSEGIALGGIAGLEAARGEHETARARFEEALAIHRSIGNRRFEGETLGNLGEVLSCLGRRQEAREALRAAEALLREIDDLLDLAKVLCIRGRFNAGDGEIDTGRAALVQAEDIAAALDASAESELRREIASLRDALAKAVQT
jgi:predicted ATPase/class 3 adenylate cyclase/Tfp pilus assembly protein PilF